MVQQAFPENRLMSYSIISGGCANINVRIIVESINHPFILRVYLRDKEAAYREQKLGELLKPTISVPEVYFIGDYEQYRFAITEYLSGMALRDLFLSMESYDVFSIMLDAGKILAKIQQHHFSTAGFFDEQLNIATMTSKDEFIGFAHRCLCHPVIIACLNTEIIKKIAFYLEKLKDYLPDENESHLVHGDYDPANILVDKQDGQWKITGILDWEFSFSGSPFFDVANMLRYAHHMSPEFEKAFIQGLSENYILPKDWRITMHLLNLVSLLDCLTRSSIEQEPNRCADIVELIIYITAQLENK